MGKVATHAREERAGRGVVQVDVGAVRHHELDAPERIERPGLLPDCDPIADLLDERIGRHHDLAADEQFVLFLREVAGVGDRLRADLLALNRRRHIPWWLELHGDEVDGEQRRVVLHRVPHHHVHRQHLRLRIGGPAQRIEAEAGDVDDDRWRREGARQPAPPLQRELDLAHLRGEGPREAEARGVADHAIGAEALPPLEMLDRLGECVVVQGVAVGHAIDGTAVGEVAEQGEQAAELWGAGVDRAGLESARNVGQCRERRVGGEQAVGLQHRDEPAVVIERRLERTERRHRIGRRGQRHQRAGNVERFARQEQGGVQRARVDAAAVERESVPRRRHREGQIPDGTE